MVPICGIFGIYLRDPDLRVNLDDVLDTGLLSIESRGTDATGFVAITDDGVGDWQKASCGATEFVKYRRWLPNGTRLLLGHTRWATQGLPAFMENNHPIRRGPYFIIHNGHVTNDAELFKTAERKRFGQVDSEAIAARLASLDDLSALSTVMEEITGAAAVAAVDERDPERLVIARGQSSPLYLYNGRGIVIFGSTSESVQVAHENHVGAMAKDRFNYLEEGTQLEWKGRSECKLSKFKVPERKVYSWVKDEKYGGWMGHSGGYESSYATSQLSLNKGALDTPRDEDTDDWDHFDCDNCGGEVLYTDAEYRSMPTERITWIFCDDCAAMWDEREDERDLFGKTASDNWDTIDVDPTEDEEGEGISCGVPTQNFLDEYEEANNAILRSHEDGESSLLRTFWDKWGGVI